MKKLLLSIMASATLVSSVFAVDYNSDQAIKKEVATNTLRAMMLRNEFKNSPEILIQKLDALNVESEQKFALEHIAAYIVDPKIKKEATILILKALEVTSSTKNGSREALAQELRPLELEIAQRLTLEEFAVVAKIVSETLIEVNKMETVLTAEIVKMIQQVKDMQVKKTIFQKFCGFFSENKEGICLAMIGLMLYSVCSNLTELVALHR